MAKDAEADFMVPDLNAALHGVDFDFSIASIYVWIRKLEALHLIQCSRVDRTHPGRPRIYYKISPEGILAIEEIRRKIHKVFGPL